MSSLITKGYRIDKEKTHKNSTMHLEEWNTTAKKRWFFVDSITDNQINPWLA